MGKKSFREFAEIDAKLTETDYSNAVHEHNVRVSQMKKTAGLTDENLFKAILSGDEDELNSFLEEEDKFNELLI